MKPNPNPDPDPNPNPNPDPNPNPNPNPYGRRIVDAMASVKLNVLHWHLSDDQGFRVESKKHPSLHRDGSDGQYYTQEEIHALVRWASERGVRVMPEFDIPGPYDTARMIEAARSSNFPL